MTPTTAWLAQWNQNHYEFFFVTPVAASSIVSTSAKENFSSVS
jgi:hypothetical protein